MPEQPVDPIAKLARFTPAPAGPDRDAVLFAAGRASVRRSWRWPAVAGLLAVSQAVTLFVLWPSVRTETATVAAVVQESSATEFVPPASPAPGSIIWYRSEDRLPPSPGVSPDALAVNGPPMLAGKRVLD